MRKATPVELSWLLWWFATASFGAQEAESTVKKSSTKSLSESTDCWAMRGTGRSTDSIINPRRVSTEGEAWDKFEAEYRSQHPSSLLVLRQLESAKYFLDATTFGFERFFRNIQDRTEFKLERGWLRHVPPSGPPSYRLSTNPWLDGLKHVRVKVDVKPRIGQPYVGVHITIPFGN